MPDGKTISPSSARGRARGAAPVRRRSRIEQRLHVEHAVADVLGRSPDVMQAAPQVVRAICLELGWMCGAFWIEPAAGAGFVCAGTWGPDNKHIDHFLSGSSVHGPTGLSGAPDRIRPIDKPLWIGDAFLLAGSTRGAAAMAAGLRSAFLLPIVAEGRVIGVVEFFNQQIDRPDAELLDCAHYIGSQIGQFCLRAQAQMRLSESEKRFADTIELAAIGIAHVDAAGRYVHANRSMCEMLGYTRDELLGMTVKQVSHPDDKNVTDDVRARMRSGEISSFQMEKRYLRKDGSIVWVGLTISVQRDAEGRPLHDISMVQDISARKQAEIALRHSEQRFRSMVEFSSDWYWEMDASLRFTAFEGQGADEGYVPARLVVGCLAWEIPGADPACDWGDLRARLERHEAFRDFEYSYTDRHGRRFHISVCGEALLDDDGRFVGYRGTSRDISLRKQAEARIRFLATHDELTGLPNRVMFSEVLTHVLESSRRNARKCAVLFIDLDRFKLINDSLGHEAGDTLLREVALRLKTCLRSSDMVARLGGDEFVVLVPELQDSEHASTVARKLLSAVIKPVELGGQEWRVTASIGISSFPDDAQDEPSLMKHADIAMYHAKEEGKNNFQFYDSRLKAQSLERLALETHLRRAIERGELSIHYQAKLELATNTLSGVEALLRWNSPELGAVTPAKFIPLAEETGLILSIGKWVLRNACLQVMAWQKDGLDPVRVAVNLSPRQLSDPNLIADVRTVLEETRMPPDLLELEVTESSVMHNVERAVEVLSALRAMGVRLAIDDFGTGYSSLAQLKRFPIDTLKVDRSFIREIPDDAEDRAIAEAIIAMGRTLSLTVVAEGVETIEQQEFLRAQGCDQMQGYYFSKPIAANEFAELLRTHRG